MTISCMGERRRERMARIISSREEAILHGKAEIFKYIFHFADSMALKCAAELGIADIIHAHDHPITLSQIASGINPSCLNMDYLHRIMRMLVRMKIFTSTTQSDDGDTLYGLTPSSELLLNDAECNLAPVLLLDTHPMMLAPWNFLGRCVKEGGSGFKKAHGHELFEMASTNTELNKIFNTAMLCLTKNVMEAIVSIYREDFSNNIGSLVDVGGGTGQAMAEIVKAFPHIKGINFDLPHVVAAAPEYKGVSHVAGDMFESVPIADAIFIKHILHNWGDEDCVKILRNCRKSIRQKSGKIIIVDPILKEKACGLFGNIDVILDLLMIALFPGGKERTEVEWKKLLDEGGFSSSYKVLELPYYASIIEAYRNEFKCDDVM